MPKMRTTIGRLMVNEALPEDMRDDERVLDKKTLTALLSDLAQRHPAKYREVSHKLANIGHRVATATGGYSFGLKHLRPAKSALKLRRQLKANLDKIDEDDSLDDEQRSKAILTAVGRIAERQAADVYDESLSEGNPLALQVLSGARGNKNNITSLRGSDLLYTDHRGKVLPLPVLRSYSEGLEPAEYWAGTYGARKGTMDTKFATQDAGFLSKQLNQIAHRAIVVGADSDEDDKTQRGYPVDTDDHENEGSLLAMKVGGYPRNTVLSPKILAELRRAKIKRILVRSPIVGGTPDGGVYGRDVGIREFGRIPVSGENVGLAAAQALSEPLSQAQMSSKHGGGVAGSSEEKATGGFAKINQLVQTPKMFKGGAAHANKDGLVQHVEEAPAGGHYVSIDSERHYVGEGYGIKVKKGDKVEAGDVISEGIPNPSIIVQHKGVGEGRRYFVNAFRQAFKDAGIKGHRRNIELLAKGLINHVRLTDEMGDYAPDDVVPYSTLEHRYEPREGFRDVEPKAAVGSYLERPYLHYSVGTKVRPSMLRDMDDFGVKSLTVHNDPPPFQPEMIRGMSNLQHDPDWITRMMGSGLKSSLLKGVHRGAYSDPTGTSFVPGLAQTVNFGTQGKVVTPNAATSRVDDADRQQQTFKMGGVLSDRACKLRDVLVKASEETPEIAGATTGQRMIDERKARALRLHQLMQMAYRGDQAVYDEMQNMYKAKERWDHELTGGYLDSATDWLAVKHMTKNIPEQPMKNLAGEEYEHSGYIYHNPEQYGYTYKPPQLDWKLPEGADVEDYTLPNHPDSPDGSIPTEDRWGLWVLNGRGGWYSTPDWRHPQNYINRYNEALRSGTPISASAAMSMYRQAKGYEEDWDHADETFRTPDTAWQFADAKARANLMRQLYAQQNKDGGTWSPTRDYADIGAERKPPAEYRQFYADHYGQDAPPFGETYDGRHLNYRTDALKDFMGKYRGDKRFQEHLASFPRGAQIEHMKARATILHGHQTGRLSPQESADQLASLNDTVMATTPKDSWYHLRFHNREYPTSTAATPYKFNLPAPEGMRQDRKLSHRLQNAMYSDPQFVAKYNEMGADAARIPLMKAVASASFAWDEGRMTSEELENRMYQIAGTFLASTPENISANLSTTAANVPPALENIARYTPGTPAPAAPSAQPPAAAPQPPVAQQPPAQPPVAQPPVAQQPPAQPPAAQPPAAQPPAAQPPVAQQPSPSSQIAAAPHMGNQQRTEYTPGPGLLPYAQMLEQYSPGTAGKLLQKTGPLGFISLVDTNALASLTRGAQRAAPQAPQAFQQPPQPQAKQPAPAPAQPAAPAKPAPTQQSAAPPARPQPRQIAANPVDAPRMRPPPKPFKPMKPSSPIPGMV